MGIFKIQIEGRLQDLKDSPRELFRGRGCKWCLNASVGGWHYHTVKYGQERGSPITFVSH